MSLKHTREVIRLETETAQKSLSATINSVAKSGKYVILQEKGKDKAALVYLKDLALLIDKMEDLEDIAEARKAIKEPGAIPLKQLKAKLGLFS